MQQNTLTLNKNKRHQQDYTVKLMHAFETIIIYNAIYKH